MGFPRRLRTRGESLKCVRYTRKRVSNRALTHNMKSIVMNNGFRPHEQPLDGVVTCYHTVGLVQIGLDVTAAVPLR
jgi:hypothetical protein